MNYREEAILEPELLNRLSTGFRHSSKLSEELSRMEIQTADRQSSNAGFLARIKYTLFASQDSGVQASFVASCKLSINAESETSLVGVKADCSCVLLRVDARSTRATEIASVSLPTSNEGYYMSSMMLGRTQGHLCAVSVGEGRIFLLTVKGDLIGVKKSIALPVTAPITGVFLNERNGVIELFVVLEKTHVVVVPDITKSTEYYFVFTKSLKNRIKLSEFSSITDESISTAWEQRSRTKAHERHLLDTSVLLHSRLNAIESLDQFRVVYLHEKAVELALLRHPSASITSIVRADSLAAVTESLKTAHPASYDSLINKEAERLETHLAMEKTLFEISEIIFDENSKKIIIYFSDGHISEIVPTESVLERYLNTFLSAPFVFRFLSQRLSRDSVLNLFGATKEWVNLFVCSSVAESIGSCFLETCSPALVKSKLAQALTGDVKDHIDSCLDIISYVTKEKRMEMICSMITAELNANLDSVDELFFSQVISTSVGNMYRVAKYYTAYALYSDSPVRADIEQLIPRLAVLNHILTHYQLSRIRGLRNHIIIACKSNSISELLNKIELCFAAPSMFPVEVSYLASTTDVAAHAGFRKFHLARWLAGSSFASDRERAWELAQASETEMSLFIPYLTASEESKTINPSVAYLAVVKQWFAGDYVHETAILEKLSVISQNEDFKKQLVEKAIAHGDWKRTKELLDRIPKSQAAFKQHAVRLVCTEARIRNELGAVFDLLRTNRDVITVIVGVIDMEIQNGNDEKLFMQIYSLCVFVEDYDTSVRAMLRWYTSLSCPYTSIGPNIIDIEFELEDVRARLELQLKALLLARAVISKIEKSVISISELKKLIVLVEGLIAYYSFVSDPTDLETPQGVNVMTLCRTLAALGLGILSYDIAARFRLDVFKSTISPLIELVLRCERDPEYLPPCRWAPEDSADRPLIPEITPAMAFVRSDASGPIRAGGSQLRAILKSVEYLLEKAGSKRVTLEAIEHIVLVHDRERPYAFLVDLIERQKGWCDLLKVYMRKEMYRECVRLVETHLKYWRPEVTAPISSLDFVVNVPLLVQLQRALHMTANESGEMAQLSEKLDQTLEIVKGTLNDLADRLI